MFNDIINILGLFTDALAKISGLMNKMLGLGEDPFAATKIAF